MDVTRGFDRHVIIDLTEKEATEFRQWIDSVNTNLEPLADDISDAIFTTVNESATDWLTKLVRS